MKQPIFVLIIVIAVILGTFFGVADWYKNHFLSNQKIANQDINMICSKENVFCNNKCWQPCLSGDDFVCQPYDVNTNNDPFCENKSLGIKYVAKQVFEDQYNLFQNSSDFIIDFVKYKDYGLIKSGKYIDYHLLSANPCNYLGAVHCDNFIFITKDYQSFILDSGVFSEESTEFNKSESILNKNKIVGVDIILSEYPPETIDMGKFDLQRSRIDWELLATNAIELSNSINAPTDLSQWKFFAIPFDQKQSLDSNIVDDVLKNFSLTSLEVKVLDKNGILYNYSLKLKDDFSNFKKELVDQTPLYNLYDGFLPQGCTNRISILKNISDNDLITLTTTKDDITLYTLKDPDHIINQAAYEAKENDPILGGSSLPNFSTYVASNPVLFTKDPWGRFIGFQEGQYLRGAGCGKPVIYLYPPKPTEVTVKFINPINLTTDIPKYASGWKVLAKPNGELVDLQPEYTDCNKIDYQIFGSDYAKDACQQGVYPYLYWAGQTCGLYPTPNGGWIVAKDELKDFLNQKLIELGLNDIERKDMTDYWVPKLLGKSVPYYRLSFFQTKQMNNFIPMSVTPKPDTVFRVFLDWSPLTAIPKIQPEPQFLDHLERKGFTLVEWGGLKQ